MRLAALLLLLLFAPLAWAQSCGITTATDHVSDASLAVAGQHCAEDTDGSTNAEFSGGTCAQGVDGHGTVAIMKMSTWHSEFYGTVCHYSVHHFPDSEKCVLPNVYNPVTRSCQIPCEDREDENLSYGGLGVQVGDSYCNAGCEWIVYGIDGGFTPAQPTGSSCAARENVPCIDGESLTTTSGGIVVCRPTDTDEDGIPDNQDDFPNDPDETVDSDEDGIGDNADHKPDDPTDGKDEDEEGGDEGDNVSHGGGNCATRPESSGDGILAQIAYQTWATRCAIERAQATDGSLKVSGNGTGGAIAVAGGGGTDLGMGDATAEDLGNPGNGGEHPGVDSLFEDSDLSATIAAGPSETGLGLSRTCPLLVLPNLELSFGSVTMPWANMCSWLDMLAGLIVLAGTIQWAFILGKIGT